MNGNYPTEDYPEGDYQKVIKCESEKSYQLHDTHAKKSLGRNKSSSTKKRRAPEPPSKISDRTTLNYPDTSNSIYEYKSASNTDPPIDYQYDDENGNDSAFVGNRVRNTQFLSTFDERAITYKATRPHQQNNSRPTTSIGHGRSKDNVPSKIKLSLQRFCESKKEVPPYVDIYNIEKSNEYPLHNGINDDDNAPATDSEDEFALINTDIIEDKLATKPYPSIRISNSGRTSIGGTHYHDNSISHAGTESQSKTNLIDTSKASVNQHDRDKPYVETSCLLEAQKKLTIYRKLILSSGKGCGKTYLGKLLLHKYSTQSDQFHHLMTPVILRFAQQWSTVVTPKENMIILLDDIFGKVAVDKRNLEDWKLLFPDIHTCINDDSCSVHVIITIRENILRQITNELVQFDLFRDIDTCTCKYLVHIKYDDTDKETILRNYFSHFNTKRSTTRQISKNEIDNCVHEVLQMHVPYAFPLCCVEYLSNVKYYLQGTTFFTNPVEVFLPEFRSMYKTDKCTFFLLSLVLFSPGQKFQINIQSSENANYGTFVKEIAEFCSIQKSFDALLGEVELKRRELDNIFIYQVNTEVCFKFDVILNLMIHAVGENHMHFLLRKMEFSVLLKYSTVSNNYSYPIKKIVISEHFRHALTSRFLEEAEKGSLKEIVWSEEMEDYCFVENFISQLKTTTHYEMCLGKGNNSGSLLSLSIKHCPPRYKLMDEVTKSAPKKNKGMIFKHEEYPEWFLNEVYHVLRCAIEQNDINACKSVTRCLNWVTHLPNEILHLCARCRDDNIFNDVMEHYPQSKRRAEKAKRLRKTFLCQVTTDYQYTRCPCFWKKSYNLTS